MSFTKNPEFLIFDYKEIYDRVKNTQENSTAADNRWKLKAWIEKLRYKEQTLLKEVKLDAKFILCNAQRKNKPRKTCQRKRERDNGTILYVKNREKDDKLTGFLSGCPYHLEEQP